MQFIKNRFVKITLWLITGILILFLLLAGAVQIPYIQTRAIQYLAKNISLKTGFNTSINHVSIHWFDRIAIDGIIIYDIEMNPMIAVELIEVNYDLSSLYNENEIFIDHTTLKKADVFVTKVLTPDSSYAVNINLFAKNIGKLVKRTRTKPKKEFNINNIDLSESSFSYDNNLADSMKNKFDYYHFSINQVNTSITDFKVISDTVSFSIHNLTGLEPQTNMPIHSINTKFLITRKFLELSELNASIGKSNIKNYLAFEYEDYTDFTDFNNNINIISHLKGSLIDTKDIATLFPFKKKLYKQMFVDGDFEGKVRSFSFSNFKLSFDRVNTIQGRVRMYGLPVLDETFIDLRLTKSYVEPKAIINFFRPGTQSLLKQFEYASFTGKFLGFSNDFVATGNFNTDLGHISSDINLKFFEASPAQYEGSLQMLNFDLGKYSNKKGVFNKVTLQGKIKGSGLTFSTADFSLDGTVQKLDLYNYSYKNITSNARFAEEFFEGKLKIDDPNLKMKIEGNIDLRNSSDQYKAHINLEKAQLDSLKLTSKDILLIADIDIDASGLTLDNVKGNAKIKDAFIEYENIPLYFDSLNVISETYKDQRRFLLTSDLIDWEFSGNFNYSQLVNELRTLYKEYKLNIKNDFDEIQDYYSNKPNSELEGSNIVYELNLKNIAPFVHLIPGNNNISQNFSLHGVYQSGYTTIIAFSTEIDSILYKGNTFIGNTIDVSASKIADSTSVLAGIYLHSNEQTFSNKITTQNLLLETFWDKNHVSFETNIEQQQLDNTLHLNGYIDFLKDTTLLHFDSSKMVVLENSWDFDQGNSIKIVNKDIIFNKFNVKSINRQIDITGTISPNPEKELLLNLEDFDIAFINPVIKKVLSGSLNGYVKVRNYYASPIIENELSIEEFEVDSFLVGNVFANTKWQNNNRSLRINAFLKRQGFQTINIEGQYSPFVSYKPLQLIANFDAADVNILEPFLSGYFSNITGNATGSFKIEGNLNAPIIEGQGFVNNGTIKVDYLNTDYRFSGSIGLNENSILFNSINLLDVYNNTGTLTGKINHTNFRNMYLDLEGDITNFQVLNTSSKDNSLFYGSGFTTGKINFVGPVNNLGIHALATTNKGTRIYIPLSDSESIEQEDYINFIDFSDTTHLETTEKTSVKLSNVNLNFDLDITPDAYCEIIFDIKSGDIIRGRGNGRINMQIDTQGEFNMFGDYVIQEGGYNFTLYNIINKEFSINPNSKISWFGDPYDGNLDIDATYNQFTSLLPLVTDTSFQTSPTLRRSYPVDLGLSINGTLSSPQIGFNIDVLDYPIQAINNSSGGTIFLEDVVSDFKNRIKNDEHELNRQVFSLLVLRKLSPPESFNTGGTIGNSVSEFVSNQLSYWVSQVDENLEIDVDLGSLDAEAFNTFQLRLSYTLLGGRLRISREGGFSSNTGETQQNDVAGIVGDWTVEYLLTEDGKLKAKMYNRTNYNSLNNSLGNSSSTTTGVSLQHTQNFDLIRDLWQKERKKKQKKHNNVNQKATTILKDEEI